MERDRIPEQDVVKEREQVQEEEREREQEEALEREQEEEVGKAAVDLPRAPAGTVCVLHVGRKKRTLHCSVQKILDKGGRG